MPDIKCTADTIKSGNDLFGVNGNQYRFKGKGCRASCRLADLSLEPDNMDCYDGNDKFVKNVRRITVGGYCMIRCKDEPQKVFCLFYLKNINHLISRYLFQNGEQFVRKTVNGAANWSIKCVNHCAPLMSSGRGNCTLMENELRMI